MKHPSSEDESTPEPSSPPERALPPNTRVVNEETGQLRMYFKRGGGKPYVKYGKDVAALVAWRKEIEAKLDAEGVPPTQVKTAAARQSATPGVHWHEAAQKWRGACYDRLASKEVNTSYFATEAETVAALAVLRDHVNAAFEAEMQRRYAAAAESTPNLRNLPRAPAKASDAEVGTVYWHVVKQTDYAPYRAVWGGKQYQIACAECPQQAQAGVKGETPTHCMQHGGGAAARCIHQRARSKCLHCNPKVLKCVTNCDNCGNRLSTKRMRSNGGNGMCAMCEDHARAQAAESGSAPPAKSRRWEDVVFDALLPLIVDADGDVVAPELRDDFSHTLGSLYEEAVDGGGRKLRKRKRGKEDCDTITFRRPDAMFVKRDPDTSRIVAVLAVEVDEDCHVTRKFSCETGKVEDTFQAVQKLAAGEGASAASRTGVRHDAELVYFATFKFNPNNFDAKPPVKLDDRIAVLARACSAFLARPAAEYAAMPLATRAVPHVTTFFYHSKACSLEAPDEPSKNFLLEFPKLEPDWAWHGNVIS
jgi:hypothetical protein